LKNILARKGIQATVTEW